MAAAAVESVVMTTSTSTAVTATTTTMAITAKTADTYNNQLIAETEEMSEVAMATAMVTETTIY